MFKAPDAETHAFTGTKPSLTPTVFSGSGTDRKKEKNRSVYGYCVAKKLGIQLTYPSAYKVVKDTTNFVRIEKPTSKGHNNILVYTLPKALSILGPQRILDIRDSIGKAHVPGRFPEVI